MKQFEIQTWIQVFQLFAAAVVIRAGAVRRPPGTNAFENSAGESPGLRRSKEEEASFLEMIDEHQSIIYKVCRSWSSTKADKEDLYQEIVFQLWKFYPSFKGDSKLSTWIYQIALHAAFLPYRRKNVPIEYQDVLADQPSNESSREGLDDHLFALVHKLDATDRAILVLVVEGFRTNEIGAILHLTRKAVNMRMIRIRSAIEK